MAVLLCRNDGKPAVPSLDQKKHPKIIIRNEPLISIASHRGKRVVNRSESQYASEEQTRDEAWRKAYERRNAQLSCGFHGTQHKPYHDVGKVTLDDKNLFVEGLGQSNVLEQVKVGEPERREQQPTLPAPEKLPLRAKTSSQFPTQLLSLQETLENVETKLVLIRKGRGLFQLLKEAEIEKQREIDLKVAQEAEAKLRDWKEGIVCQEPDIEKMSLPPLLDHASPDHLSLPAVPINAVSGEHSTCSITNGSKVETAALLPEEAGTIDVIPEHSNSNQSDDVTSWYYFLCVVLWVLEAMRMMSPRYMPLLHDFWRLSHPKPNEQVGKKIAERQEVLLSKWETIFNSQRQKSSQKQTAQLTVLPAKPTLHMDDAATHIGTSEEHKNACSIPKAQKRKSNIDIMRKQKKLTPAQLENLVAILDDELNYSKKQTRARLNTLMQEADEKMRVPTTDGASCDPVPVSLDVAEKMKMLSQADEERQMVVHEQLAAMERDRNKALQQRFTGLKITGNLWEDLSQMREGVHIESTSMARKKLLMNYSWYSDLYAMLPPNAKTDQYCCKLLGDLRRVSEYMFSVGPRKMSRRKMIQVLSTLRPWELQSPAVHSAVEFLITKMTLEVWNDFPEFPEAATNWNHPPPTVIERYYTKYFYSSRGTDGVSEDQCVLFHSNKVCVVCIAPNHELLREPEVAIKEIDFQMGKHDRSKSQVSGKRKNKGDRS
ncbi:hypothetical protein EMCRGX_G013344 [Ephydatia muelleri]